MWPFSRSDTQQQPPSSREDVTDAPSVVRKDSPTPIAPAPAEPTTTPTETPAELAKLDPYRLTGYPNERVSMLPSIRWPIILCVVFAYGFSEGAARGGRIAADRYRAMNAHRLPATQAGWYLYHRSKSYHTALGGMTGGVKQGGIGCFWTMVYLLAEEGLDQARGRLFARKDEDMRPGQRDFVNTTTAVLTTAGLYSRWHRLDVFATARVARTGLGFGVGYGLFQDMIATIRGEPPTYVTRFRRVFGAGAPG